MLLTLLLASAQADRLTFLPSVELAAGAGYGATGGELETEDTGLFGSEADPPVLQVMGPALDGRFSLALKRGRWWQFQGVLSGFWVPLPVVRYDGDAEEDPDSDPFLAQLHAGVALSVHPGPRIRVNGGAGLVGQKFRTDLSIRDYTRLGVGWEVNAMWVYDVGRKWAVGIGIGTSGHAVPRTGPDKTLFSGGEAGLRVTFIQDGMKEKWQPVRERAGRSGTPPPDPLPGSPR